MRDGEMVEKNGVAGVTGGLADTRTGQVVGVADLAASGVALFHQVAYSVIDLHVEVAGLPRTGAHPIAHTNLAAQLVVVVAGGGRVDVGEVVRFALRYELVVGVVLVGGLKSRAVRLGARVVHQGEVAPAVVFAVDDCAVAEVDGRGCEGADLRGDGGGGDAGRGRGCDRESARLDEKRYLINSCLRLMGKRWRVIWLKGKERLGARYKT